MTSKYVLVPTSVGRTVYEPMYLTVNVQTVSVTITPGARAGESIVTSK